MIHNRGPINQKSISVKSMQKSNRKITDVTTVKESYNPTLAMLSNMAKRSLLERIMKNESHLGMKLSTQKSSFYNF